MRTFLILCIFSSLLSTFAQQASGSLFVYTQSSSQTPELGYISFPSNTYQLLDTIAAADMLVFNHYLYVAETDENDQGNAILGYDLATTEREIYLPNMKARFIERWDKQLVLGCTEAPFFRVLDMSDNFQLEFDLGSSKVPRRMRDLLVYENRAFVLLEDEMIVVDMLLQDTIARVPTPAPYPNQNYNQYLIEHEGILYIDIEYATGAYRASLLRVDPQTLEVETAFHAEGQYSRYRPVPTVQSIFLYSFDSHFSIPQDSLLLNPAAAIPYAIEYDAAGDFIFIYTETTQEIRHFHNGNYSPPFSLPSPLRNALFYQENISLSNLPETSHSFQLYPNPSQYKKIHIQSPEKAFSQLKIWNMKGKLMQEQRFPHPQQFHELSIEQLPVGHYILELLGNDWAGREAFIRLSP